MARRGRRRGANADGAEVHGILLADKPEGWTSADVVRRVKAKVCVKVGHLGTLDPFATGLLPICIGEATKVAQFLNTADKEYTGTIALGSATDTGDLTGEVRETQPVPDFSDAELRRVAESLSGEQMQKPPMYSALKRDGVPLYKLARQGIEVEREARPIVIRALELERLEGDRLAFRVACSKGTYVRVLAEDIGCALGTVAHLASLRRTAFGSFRFAAGGGIDPAVWDPSAGGILSISEALAELPAVELPDEAAAAVRKGQPWVLQRLGATVTSGDRAMLVDAKQVPVAVVEKKAGAWKFARVLG